MTKTSLRIYMKNARNNLSDTQQKEQSLAIQTKLFESNDYKKCEVIFTYVSFQSEVDTFTIIENALQIGKRVFVPRVSGPEIKFYEMHSIASLHRSKFGILEPDATYDNDLNANTLCTGGRKIMILPGLAFDFSGNRIGYGAGYYDRYLALHSKEGFLKIALAYDFQVVEQVYSQEHDIKADIIITPEQIVECNRHIL